MNDDQGEVAAVVIHPERLLESRIHNVVGLGQGSPQSLRQARAAIDCAHAFSRFILDSDQVGTVTRRRAVLKLNERIYRFCRLPVARQFFDATALDPFEAVVVDHAGLPQKFRTMRYPQMQLQLAKLRQQSRR